MEIGSIFEIDINKLYGVVKEGHIDFPFAKGLNYNFLCFNTGRAAIEELFNFLKQKGYKNAWLPSFLCSSVKEAIERAGFTVSLYSVEKDLSVNAQTIKNIKFSGTDVLYMVHYFGEVYADETILLIKELQLKGLHVIEDVTMSLYSKNKKYMGFGDYLVGSIRKWLPIPDGGFIASIKELPQNTLAPASNDYTLYYFAAQVMKQNYVNKPDMEKENKQGFLSLSNLAMETLFSDYQAREMSVLSKRLINAENIQEVICKREENYDLLYSLLETIPQVKLLHRRSEGMLPLGMFILVEQRDELFSHLVKNDIYCNIHWRPNDMAYEFENSLYLTQHCITLPCDQRYSEEHMQYIYDVIKSFYEDGCL